MAEPDFADTVPMPVLIVLAGADSVVSNLAAEEFSRRVKTAAHLRIPGARHEILMERDSSATSSGSRSTLLSQGAPER